MSLIKTPATIVWLVLMLATCASTWWLKSGVAASFIATASIMLIAGINVAVFYSTKLARRTNAVGAGEDAPLASKVVAAISFTAWTGVLAGGRFLGFFKPPQHWCPWCGLF